jgi:hypothetical protein
VPPRAGVVFPALLLALLVRQRRERPLVEGEVAWSCGLGGAELDLAVQDGQGPLDADGATGEVDVVPRQAEQLGLGARRCYHGVRVSVAASLAAARMKLKLDISFGDPGHPLQPNNVSRTFKREVQRTELPHATVHTLRHAHATLLQRWGVASGASLRGVGNRCGWGAGGFGGGQPEWQCAAGNARGAARPTLLMR